MIQKVIVVSLVAACCIAPSDSKCAPCHCGSVLKCSAGIPLVKDGCDCCWHCAKQKGDTCNHLLLCDASRRLVCSYRSPTDLNGTCTVMQGKHCSVANSTVRHGETFLMDCRTQCFCQNGTYACSSLCPNEALKPTSACENPRLVPVEGQCCREWMCDPDENVACAYKKGPWSQCSAAECGSGLSLRWTMKSCDKVFNARICQIRSCQNALTQQETLIKEILKSTHKHHLRKSHLCKATQKTKNSVRFRIGPCISLKRYRPKYCSFCPGRCCRVVLSTTIPVSFACPMDVTPELIKLSNSHNLLQINRTKLSDNEIVQNELNQISSKFQYFHPDLTSTDDYLLLMIKMEDHQIVKRNMQMNIRCECSKKCY